MRLLMKFGGTSVADAPCIARVVDILEQHHKQGDELAVVVSAQRGVTDQLIEIALKLPESKDASAIDREGKAHRGRLFQWLYC
jgi:aspartate kinase